MPHQSLTENSSVTSYWDSFFQLADSVDIPDDFLNDRDMSAPQERDLFRVEDWIASPRL